MLSYTLCSTTWERLDAHQTLRDSGWLGIIRLY